MTIGAKQRTPSVEVRGALLRAARELVEENGPVALSVRDIAARADVAAMGLYKHFGSKNGILDALLVEGFTDLAAAVDPANHDAPDARPGGTGFDALDSLARGLHRYRGFALAHREVYGLMFDRPLPELVPSERALAAARASFAPLVEGIGVAIATGDVRPGDPTELAQGVWAGCHGAVSLELRGISFVDDPAAHYAELIAILVRGIAARPHEA